MAIAYIAVGSNLGDRYENITAAKMLLFQSYQVSPVAESSILETLPISDLHQDDYLNTVWKVETTFSPQDLLILLLRIEKLLGRTRGEPNAARTMDLDILFYDNQIIKEHDLIVPHPRLHERHFILELLHEIDPEWEHPVFKRKVFELREALQNEKRQDFQPT